ncbi:hypothetical protein [Acinetobacter pragensis]|uniref:hypothetical protein n=1 Tax=Acinetobacter pragensis TaxID=1806892 RepID=UPI00333F3E45
MRLKYLTFCLLGLSLSACTQHVIKSTPASEGLGERAAQGINAMLETSSYDVKGQFSVQVPLNQQTEAEKPSKAPDASGLSMEQKKQIDLALKANSIQLSAKEKNQLYDAVAKEQDPYGFLGGGRERAGAGAAETMINLLNDLQFSYDGSVHYRQKMAALNFNLKYLKPTLQVQARLPVIVDFNDFKLYTNYFAFMPFMVNRDSQASYAYVDLSKYKDNFNQVDFKKLAAYLKQMNAVPFVLAAPNQLSAVALTAAEKQQGLNSKIRYQGTLEDLALQLSLFELVNEPYYTEQVKGQKNLSDAQAVAQAASAQEASTSADPAAIADSAAEQLDVKSYQSAERVGDLVRSKVHEMMYHHNEHQSEAHPADEVTVADADEAASGYAEDAGQGAAAEAACAAADECDAYGSAEAETETNAEEMDAEDSSALSVEACTALTNASKVPAGYFTQCRDRFGVDVFKPASAEARDRAAEPAAYKQSAFEQLTPIFTAYQSAQFTDAQSFKPLWQKHQAEIQQVLKAERSDSVPLTMDVGLDAAGRLQSVDYAVVKQDKKYGEFRFSSSNQISNYGQAKAIDRNVLKNAKSIEEITKGSLLERFSKGILAPLNADAASAAAETAEAPAPKTADEYLNQIARDSYKKTNSWAKAYQAVFGLYAVMKQSDLSQHYTSADLNEIAEVSAYHFNADLPKPKGAALARLNRLTEKHQLKSRDSFDDLGYSVNRIVNDAVKEYQAQQTWTQRIKQHKTRQAVFAAYYAEVFADEYSLNDEQKQQLPKTAKTVAQAFADDLNNKLSEHSIQNLHEDDADLFDEDIYRIAYRDVITHFSQ